MLTLVPVMEFFRIQKPRMARAGVQRFESLRREIVGLSLWMVTSARLVLVFIASSM